MNAVCKQESSSLFYLENEPVALIKKDTVNIEGVDIETSHVKRSHLIFFFCLKIVSD